ncbi:serine/threonine protein kinase [Neisseriaceae bacterium TC5R-5]|nr:serine/threonine protein kinase [Neisseriaceae bacterium TC5R-5]
MSDEHYNNSDPMTQSSDQTALPTDYHLAEYTIVRQLSLGGFSIVYLAVNEQGQKFAIKEYLPRNLASRTQDGQVMVSNEIDMEAFNLGLKCFFEEGRVLSGIAHPSVVRVSNFFRANQTVYMVMEYAAGRSLVRELGNLGGRMQEKLIRKWFATLLAGLREVHLHRLLHLDIKPANIYLRRNGVPLLLDFGAARQTLSRENQHFAAMYTPGFAAPEQYEKEGALGPWTDIYAIGACLYVCMGGATPQASKQRKVHDELTPASKLFNHLYSPELLALTDQCLAILPDERPATVLEVQKRLLEANYSVPTEPVLAAGVGNKCFAWFKNLMSRRS